MGKQKNKHKAQGHKGSKASGQGKSKKGETDKGDSQANRGGGGGVGNSSSCKSGKGKLPNSGGTGKNKKPSKPMFECLAGKDVSSSVRVYKGDLWLTHSERVVHVGPVLDEEGCSRVIKAAEACDDWVDVKDSVDGKAEWQHTAIDAASARSGIHKSTLQPLCEAISDRLALPVLQRTLGVDPTSVYLHWAFVRSYSCARRHDFALHRDTSVATVNILLSQPGSDFEGADLYVLDGPEFKNADSWGAKERRQKLPSDAQLAKPPFAVGSRRGEMVMHMGRQLHGVLPIEKGERYTLILMYMKKRS